MKEKKTIYIIKYFSLSRDSSMDVYGSESNKNLSKCFPEAHKLTHESRCFNYISDHSLNSIERLLKRNSDMFSKRAHIIHIMV